MISDRLFRSKNVQTRKYYVNMIEKAEREGIQTFIFSSMNPSGESIPLFLD
jgi:stalled ribosome rescue protein Dom34